MTSPKQRKKRALARNLIETARTAKLEEAPKKAAEKAPVPAEKKPATTAFKSAKKAEKPSEDFVEASAKVTSTKE